MLKNLFKLADGLLLAGMAYLTHVTIFTWFYAFNQSGVLQLQLEVLLVIGLIILWRLRSENSGRAFILAWRENWLVAIFICLAFLSLFWTVSLPVTAYRAFLAFLVTLIAAYLGLRLSPRNLVLFVAVIIGVFALMSLVLAVFFPKFAIHSEYPYVGLWHGIFWHKIYFGATMALGYIAYLVIIFSSRQQYSFGQKILAGMMLVFCLVLAILSDSASGLVVFAIQTGLFFMAFTWLSWGHLISRRAYWVLGSCVFLIIVFVFTHLDFVLGFFNRSSSLTGRVPMWLVLIKTYVAEQPWFGYGFGAFWMQSGMMQKIQSIVGWPYPVRVSDNGYLDILLGLGMVGLLLLLAILATGFWRAICGAFQLRDLTSFFPLFILVHILFINISLSYFFENETFLWFLLVMILFMPALRRDVASTTS
jgi:exopolysaccharide production protein ExoQ